jgi:hypothetical protein
MRQCKIQSIVEDQPQPISRLPQHIAAASSPWIQRLSSYSRLPVASLLSHCMQTRSILPTLLQHFAERSRKRLPTVLTYQAKGESSPQVPSCSPDAPAVCSQHAPSHMDHRAPNKQHSLHNSTFLDLCPTSPFPFIVWSSFPLPKLVFQLTVNLCFSLLFPELPRWLSSNGISVYSLVPSMNERLKELFFHRAYINPRGFPSKLPSILLLFVCGGGCVWTDGDRFIYL